MNESLTDDWLFKYLNYWYFQNIIYLRGIVFYMNVGLLCL
jgi:hypothetical protein